jgi:hypothetical protein
VENGSIELSPGLDFLQFENLSFDTPSFNQSWRELFRLGEEAAMAGAATREEALEARADAVRRHLGDGVLKSRELA